MSDACCHLAARTETHTDKTVASLKLNLDIAYHQQTTSTSYLKQAAKPNRAPPYRFDSSRYPPIPENRVPFRIY